MKEASGIKSGEILFLRIPPADLFRPPEGAGWSGRKCLGALFAPNGIRGWVGERRFTSFWIGLGRGVRLPGRKLMERMREGGVTEIIDIGCAGALNPDLSRGDLVLSSADLAFDGAFPTAVHRRVGLDSLLQEVASRRGVRFQVAPILTHERFIASRNQRIELFERTGCAAVQMEHAWFLRLLRSLLETSCFDRIRVTHLVLITDAVPPTNSRAATARSSRDALVGYLLPGGKVGIASLRREVLGVWPSV